jgi:hypothetical protein
MPDLDAHHEAWIGRTLTDASGHKIGKIDDIYTDDDTGKPEWLAVTSGLMGASTHFVPLRGASVSGAGVQVPFPKDKVKEAPSAGVEGWLSRMEKGRLYAHYGFVHTEERNRLQRSLGFDPPDVSRPADGRDVSRPVDLRDGNEPAGGRDEAKPLPPAGRSGDRGRWPDDEAIFGLSQEVLQPTLAASGESRRR